MKKLFKGCMTAIVAVIALGIIISLVSGGGDDTASTSTSTEDTTASEQTNSESEAETEEAVENAKIGEAATIDDIAFTVNEARSTQEIDDPDGNEFIEPVTTTEQFIVIDASIKNGKQEAITMDSNFFRLLTDDGTTYEPKNDGDLIMVVPTEKMLFLEEINPGLTREGLVVFEVPAGVAMESLTLEVDAGFFGTKSVQIDLQQ
ncbi:DUF4352 domain-containing protein [Halobacillus locisalis]|uniref:DUF4352 domain-containing protein n=1 Tax=Halobacillus locisalis TaxID=220753 RepID=A0A838CW30_9BACI|nr:DUF4352 domain-containing protein [Halobacillus locisalis]MBA2176039.1 DUF4352 domain-containing protein [Halobacillus locisalis]